MKIFLLDDLYSKEFHAGYKAKIDVNQTFIKGFANSEVFSFYHFKIPNFGKSSKLLRYIRLRLLFRSNQINFLKFLRKVNVGDVVILPYPFEYQWFVLLTSYVFKSLAKLKREKQIKVVYITHDLVSLRFPELDCEKIELPLLEIADTIIVHNPTMINWLISKNVPSEKLINLQIFDYLSPDPISYNESTENTVVRKVVYAGNLMPWKTEFLYKWTPKYDVELYGIGFESKEIHHRMEYKGVFNPDTPTIDVAGISFGLVWDGSSCDELIGPGEYLRYNNPHKVSLYLSQELPVIVWKEAALAPFVIANNLGFTIERLEDIDEIINNMELTDYLNIKNNVRNVGIKMRSGGFMLEALNKAIDNIK